MQKEEKLELVSEKVDKILDQNKKQRPNTKSKNRRKEANNKSTKRIKDYFPTVPKSGSEKVGDKGTGAKDESRVTEHTTPDKANIENDKSQSNKTAPSKHVYSSRHNRAD